MEQLITQFHWMQLNNEQRILMREVFNIPKSGGVVIQNNTMLTDGSNENDLKAISIESMQKFVASPDTNFEFLYNSTLIKVDQMIKERKEKEYQELEKENTHKRLFEINDIVNSTLETIINLPLDAQIKIKTALNHIGEQKENVKETSSTEENKESSNQQGTKVAGSRGRPSKRLS